MLQGLYSKWKYPDHHSSPNLSWLVGLQGRSSWAGPKRPKGPKRPRRPERTRPGPSVTPPFTSAFTGGCSLSLLLWSNTTMTGPVAKRFLEAFFDLLTDMKLVGFYLSVCVCVCFKHQHIQNRNLSFVSSGLLCVFGSYFYREAGLSQLILSCTLCMTLV